MQINQINQNQFFLIYLFYLNLFYLNQFYLNQFCLNLIFSKIISLSIQYLIYNFLHWFWSLLAISHRFHLKLLEVLKFQALMCHFKIMIDHLSLFLNFIFGLDIIFFHSSFTMVKLKDLFFEAVNFLFILLILDQLTIFTEFRFQ